MTESLIDIYTDELRFLIDLKQSVSIVNHRIHDKRPRSQSRSCVGFTPK